MYYKIVYSIPIHEEPYVVIDQIINYRRFNNDFAIVFHISKTFRFENTGFTYESFIECLKQFSFVYINPNRLDTAWADIAHTHISNFEYISTVLDEFDYFILASSNDLFLKNFTIERIQKYICGYERSSIMNDKGWMFRENVMKDQVIQGIVQRNNEAEYPFCLIKSQLEGSFYRKELFKKISDAITSGSNIQDPNNIYPREEVYFPTLSNILLGRENTEYHHYNGCLTYNSFRYSRLEYALRSDIRHVLANDDLYCVKRVARKINDPIRAYIRTEIGQYENVVVETVGLDKLPATEDINEYELRMIRNNRIIVRVIHKVQNVFYGIRKNNK